MILRIVIAVTILVATASMAEQPRWIVGSTNPDLVDGARALIAGRETEGIELTLKGLESARGNRQEEVALSNLCAGYTNLGDYKQALKYCDLALHRNSNIWQVYNSKALIYISTKEYEKAADALSRGEAINPHAKSIKIARALFLDATKPVRPEIILDDRKPTKNP